VKQHLVIFWNDINHSMLCSVDRTSLYNLVNETNLVHNSFSVYFVNITGLSGTQDGILSTSQSATQKTSAKFHIKYSCSSWWWNWRGPKHVEIINNIDETQWERFVHQVAFIYNINQSVITVMGRRCVSPAIGNEQNITFVLSWRNNVNLVPLADPRISSSYWKYSFFGWGTPMIFLAGAIVLQLRQKAGNLLDTATLQHTNCWWVPILLLKVPGCTLLTSDKLRCDMITVPCSTLLISDVIHSCYGICTRTHTANIW